jgi:MYXO-CTERM domain-containing protein
VLRANITDDTGVVRAEVFLDGKPLTKKGAGPWDFQLALPVGKHTLRVQGYDMTNKVGSAAVTVHVQGDGGHGVNPTAPTPPPPQGAKVYGQPCFSAGECQSRICANDVTMGQQYCSQPCDGSPSACPPGSACFSTLNGSRICAPVGAQGNTRPSAGMGCSVGGGPPDTTLVLLLALGLLFRRRLKE